MIKKNVPFYGNTEDDTHCFQAVVKMLLKYYFPEETYSWAELDRLTAKVKGLWTWPLAGMLKLQNKGLEVKLIEDFNFKRFIETGGDYLIEKYGEEVGQAQISHSLIPQEIDLAKKFIQSANIETRIPRIEDITTLLKTGYLVVANVNAKKLNKETGYVGHFVLIYDYDNDLYLHDPGLPPKPNRKVSLTTFNQAWAYPNETAKNIKAFRR